MIKQEIIELLKEGNIEGLLEIAEKETKKTFRTLISLAYDKEKLICWQSIEALGIISGKIGEKDPETARDLAQRILWMMREESGNNPWTAPEMLAEIIRNSPDRLADIAPVLASFHEEEILREGVLRGLLRIGEIRPNLIAGAASMTAEYINHEDNLVRAYAVMLAGILKLNSLREIISAMKSDMNEIKIYNNGEFKKFQIGEIAEEIYGSLMVNNNA